MDNRFKILISSTATLAIGFAAGYFFAKKQLEDQYHQDLEEYKNFVGSRVEKVLGEKVVSVETDEVISPGQSKENPYTNLVAEYYDGDEEDEEPEDDGLYPDPEEEFLINHRPFLIEEGEFYHGNLDYDKIELYYYRADDVFCTEADEIVPIDEIRRSLGTCYVDLIDREAMLYIRNEPQLTDYEIHSLKMSFSAEVISRAETPSEKKMRRERRKERKLK